MTNKSVTLHFKKQKPQTRKMKTTSTYLRNLISVLILAVAFTNAFSQTSNLVNTNISNLKAIVQNDRLVINWNVSDANASNYCEVQVSKDGKHFSTIGIVLGADPKQNNNGFAFKQNLAKMKTGHIYYRVLTVAANNQVSASNIVIASI